MQRPETRIMVAALALLAAACERGDEPAEAAAPVVEEVEALPPDLAARLPAGVSVAMVEQGRELFAVCAVCHGFDARGTQLGPSLRDDQWIHISGEPDEIARIITTGIAEPEEHDIPMPVLGGGEFTEEQVRALAAYVYALSHTSG